MGEPETVPLRAEETKHREEANCWDLGGSSVSHSASWWYLLSVVHNEIIMKLIIAGDVLADVNRQNYSLEALVVVVVAAAAAVPTTLQKITFSNTL